MLYKLCLSVALSSLSMAAKAQNMAVTAKVGEMSYYCANVYDRYEGGVTHVGEDVGALDQTVMKSSQIGRDAI